MKKTFVSLSLALSLVLGGCILTKPPASQPEDAGKDSPKQDVENVEEDSAALPSADSGLVNYTNTELGFSLQVPEKSVIASAACETVVKDGQNFYRPAAGEAPIKIFVDSENNKVYIDHEYFYEPSGDTTNDENGILYAKCDKVETTLEVVKNAGQPYAQYQKGWVIQTKAVKDDLALEGFIKEVYGAACGLGEKKLLSGDLYDVAIKGDGLEPPESKCFINGQTYIRYSPSLGKAATWESGQDYRFRRDVDSDGLDPEMAASFEFIK